MRRSNILRTKFKASQLETHQALKQVQDTIDRLQNHLNIDAHDADGIQVWPRRFTP
jgi:hypothetical protein